MDSHFGLPHLVAHELTCVSHKNGSSHERDGWTYKCLFSCQFVSVDFTYMNGLVGSFPGISALLPCPYVCREGKLSLLTYIRICISILWKVSNVSSIAL